MGDFLIPAWGRSGRTLQGGRGVTVEMFPVDRSVSNGGGRPADVFFLLVSAVCLRRGGGTAVRI